VKEKITNELKEKERKKEIIIIIMNE